MPGESRVNLPEEFYDKTADMLLVQPEPMYLYAMLLLGALGVSLAPPTELGLPSRTVGGQGADYAAADRDRLMLSNPMFTELFAAKVDFAGTPGNSIRINRPKFTDTTYTELSRKIATGATISTTPTKVESEQSNLTLYRYGGPYDQDNSRIAPLAVEAFDAQMGVHNLARIIGSNLVRDYHKWLDAVEVSLLDLAATTVYPDGMTADNDATSAGMFPMTFEQISRTEQLMDEANLPTFADGFRALVLTPRQVKQLRHDPEFQENSEFFPQYNVLFPQYVTSVGKFHIFKSTTLNKPNNGSSIAIHKGHAIAPGVLLGGMGRKPRVAPSTDDNYGEAAKVIWLSDLAFGLADNRFVYSVRSSA